MKSREITQAFAKSVVHYDPETGEFHRHDGGSLREFLNTSGYRTFYVPVPGQREKVKIRAHRLAWLIMTGEHPPVLDHINGDRLDNRWRNLRKADKAANAWNRAKASNNTSGVKGVYAGRDGRWCCRVDVRGKRHWLGAYDDLDLAEFVVQEFRLMKHGEFAHFG